MNLSAARDDLMPRPPDARGRGLMLALLMHVLLVIGLAFSVNWKSSSQTDAVVAELWSAVPQAAAPAPAPEPVVEPPKPQVKPEPRPTPPVERETPDRDAEIALEKQRKQREAQQREEERKEQARKEAERQQKEEAAEKQKRELAEKKRLDEEKERKAAEAEQKRKAALEEKRNAELREQQLKRLLSQAGTGSQESGVPKGGAAAGSPSAGYGDRLRARIRPNIVFTDNVAGNPAAKVEVRTAPDGTILGTRIIASSGNAEWDQAVIRALEKTQSLPRDDNGRVPSPLEITFRPKDF